MASMATFIKRMFGPQGLQAPSAKAERVTGRLAGWLRELALGRYRSVWRGMSNYGGYCNGVVETTRRRRRILELRGAPFSNAELFEDRLTALHKARAAEYPTTFLGRAA